ncbi:hypothetical protein CRUP_016900, partial [Coryphaenoides rupestris]
MSTPSATTAPCWPPPGEGSPCLGSGWCARTWKPSTPSPTPPPPAR